MDEFLKQMSAMISASLQMFVERGTNTQSFAFSKGYGIFARKLDGPHTSFTPEKIIRRLGKYSAAQLKGCYHCQKNIENPKIEFLLHKWQNLWLMAPSVIPVRPFQ